MSCPRRRSRSTTSDDLPARIPEHGEVPWLPISEVTLDEAHSGELAAASVLDINAVTTDTAHGPILRATWSFPRGILSEAEVTELAELWARALGALSEYVEEHSERELTPTDLDLVTADQQSIEQLERRFPDLTDIWSLSPLQSGMLFHAQFDETEIDPYMVQLTLELGGRVGGAAPAPPPRRPWLIVIRACARDLSPHREGGHCR